MFRESPFRLDGRVAVVTGGASGIGEAIVRAFADEGARIAIFDRNGDAARRVADEIGPPNVVTPFVVDVTDRGSVDSAIADVGSMMGDIYVLINSAGFNTFAAPQDVTDELWNRLLAVNLSGTWHCCSAVMPGMISRRSGRIINIASAAGLLAIPRAIPYTTAKHGVVGLTRALAADLGEYGITANCICPGPTLTPLLEQATTETFKAEAIKRLPLRRLGRPEDITGAILFLTSDLASWITGVALPIDGGQVAVVRAQHQE